MASTGALLPSAAVMEAWTKLDDARSWAALAPERLRELLEILGDADLDNIVLMAALDPSMVRDAMEKVRKDVGGVASPWSAFERVKANLLYNASRQRFGMPLVDLCAPWTCSRGWPCEWTGSLAPCPEWTGSLGAGPPD